MEIVFALIMLTLLVVAWRSYRKGNADWLRQERYEESGAWLDKRAGERGSYGSLDEEMEQERRLMRREAAGAELADLLRLHLFRASPTVFAELRDDQIRRIKASTEGWAQSVVSAAEQLMRQGRLDPGPHHVALASEPALLLKKKAMDFLFHFYPKLLEAEIEQLKNLDGWVLAAGQNLLGQLECEKILFSDEPHATPSGKI
ncbi:MAG TPA: hypothetical protein PK971_11740 [Saprospiraceae bacterium]|nr:hypothetical protein [Saprospiraceae bacterium]HND88996.1 hypothetical protein [Saprospiraceae bacterium]HNG89471.1 hypothetical protein [Saprospiraceae bacterium]